MYLRSSATINTAALKQLLPHFIARKHSSSTYPLYFTTIGQKNRLANNLKDQKLLIQTVRYANTSSGHYAPSAVASRCAENHASHGNINVFEDSDHLPSLPVPELKGTLEKLKESISPIAMNSTEFVNTLKLIDKFSVSAGPKLDLLLRNKAEKTKNWMTNDWWINEAYLKSRRPLVINSNPSMIFPTLPFEVKNQRALVNVISQLISGIIDFKLSLLHGLNPEATSADNECRLDPNVCYNQYKNIFGGIRLPGERIDTIETLEHVKTDESAPHSIVISYRGNFFEIQLKSIEDEKGRIDMIAEILEKILASTNEGVGQNLSGAGVLTTAKRDDWAEAFKLLDADSMNSIKEAQFIVCIDTIPTNEENFPSVLHNSPLGSEQHLAALGRQVLHGDNANIGNRWFDKALQLIIVADENAESLLGAGINYEHSFAEGVVVTKMIEYSYDKTVQKHRESANTNFFSKQQVPSHEPAIFRQLKMFNETNLDATAKHIKRAMQDFASQVEQFDLSYLNYKQYGSNAIKSWHFSPDSWFQIGLLWAYFNIHKRLGTCYESASTRRFAYGRTETIRSLTKEVAQFFNEPKFETMQAAIKSHKAYALAAGNGQAIDRVLLGYKKTFDELKTMNWSWGLPTSSDGSDSVHELLKLNEKTQRVLDKNNNQEVNLEKLFNENELNIISAFFNNELIKRSNRYALSTSQVSSIHPNIYMCYGPILADGYGCCYNITGQKIVAAITANSSNQSFSCEVDKLHKGVETSLDNMRDIMEKQR